MKLFIWKNSKILGEWFEGMLAVHAKSLDRALEIIKKDFESEYHKLNNIKTDYEKLKEMGPDKVFAEDEEGYEHVAGGA